MQDEVSQNVPECPTLSETRQEVQSPVDWVNDQNKPTRETWVELSVDISENNFAIFSKDRALIYYQWNQQKSLTLKPSDRFFTTLKQVEIWKQTFLYILFYTQYIGGYLPVRPQLRQWPYQESKIQLF